MSFYVVVEKVDYTTSMKNAILPKNQMLNLAVYTSLKKAYMLYGSYKIFSCCEIRI